VGGLALLGAVVVAQTSRVGDVEITPIIHSSVQIEHAGKVIHVDPWSLGDYSHAKPADLILITDDVGPQRRSRNYENRARRS
jgi:hypothetical protein